MENSSSSAGSTIGGELPFKLALTGYGGHLRVEPLPPVRRETPFSSLPDLILPPALPKETPESIRKSIELEYLIPGLDHEEDSADRCGKLWDFEWLGEELSLLDPTVPRTAVIPVWQPPFRRTIKNEQKCMAVGSNAAELDGGIVNGSDPMDWVPEFEEVDVIHHNEGAHNSSSVLRRPGPPEEFVRGSTINHPFRPGGFDLSHPMEKHMTSRETVGDALQAVLEGGPLHTTPPGFTRGLDLGAPKPLSTRRHTIVADYSTGIHQKGDDQKGSGQVQFTDLFRRAWEEEQTEQEGVGGESNEDTDEAVESGTEGIEAEVTILEDILADLKEEKILIKTTEEKKKKENESWAIKGGDDGVVERFSEFVPDMAISFPFDLDSFQKEAVYHLERSESVFVAAHTSAGKTVVAEYAFALATKHCTRAVYTSPIKTISNQKYRDFADRFDVGLITGDVSLRPEASCLIMTTEILRSMLYKGADIVRDIEWVIFDEVHYINDIERGVVWEEVIIMLPDHVNMVLLSATVPNTFEFADWIGRTKKKKIYVTGTSRRPVPLEHCIYYAGELYNICDNDTFLPQGVKEAKHAFDLKNSLKVGAAPGKSGALTPGHGGPGRGWATRGKGNQGQRGSGHLGAAAVTQRAGSGGWKSETSQWYSLINHLSKKGLLPVVVFCFSKNRCDQLANSLTAADLTSTSEKSEIHLFCNKGFSRLKGSDRQLPQILRLEDLLRRGIGVHHAGLLPIVKEVVEMLFCRGVIKVLFSTETFAMGVNAPARTVAFHSLRKHDGKTFRQLLPGEYTQMAGRAGRRGLDKVGTVVIMCWEDIPGEGDLRRLLTGKPMKLESQFRLTYNMILNLLRVEDIKVEDMLKRSFAEFHAQRALPEQQQQLQKGEGELSQIKSIINCILGEPTIEEYYEVALQAEKIGDEIQDTVMQSRAAQQLLTPGRVVVICTPMTSAPTLGVILKAPTGAIKNWIVLAINRGTNLFESSTSFNSTDTDSYNKTSADEGYFITRKSSRSFEDEYSVSGKGSRKGSGTVKVTLPYFGTMGGTGYVAMELDAKGFVSICKSKIQVDTLRLLEDVSAAAYSLTVQQLLDLERDYPGQGPPALDPVKDLKLNDLDVVKKYNLRQTLLEKMAQNQCHICPKLREHYNLIKNQHTLKEKVKQLKFELSDAALQQMPDFQQRIEVLQDVGCIDADLVVQLKGRVACEINSGDELIATECLLDNQLMDLEAAEAVALLSALVFQQKDASEPFLTPRLEAARDRIMTTAIRLGEIQASHGLPIHPEDYARHSLKFGLVEAVYEWAKGTPFAEICELTDVPEGSIVRTIVRLDETCREFRNAARIIGDSALYKKMTDASEAIKRDIVFAASLYVTGVPSS